MLAEFDPEIPTSYQPCDFLMLGNLAPKVQLKVIAQLTTRPKFIALDTMNFWMDNTPDDLAIVIEKIDVLIINDEEARQLAEEYSLVKAAKIIMSLGPKYVIIKKGEHGALLFDEKEVFYAPALPLEEVVDPTGAGDTFAGGFMGYLANSENISFSNLKRAVIVGSAMASFTVEKFGTERLLELDRAEINHRIKEFYELTSFDLELT